MSSQKEPQPKKKTYQEHANIKIWAESYDLLINLQVALPGHPNFVDMVHQSLSQYAKMLNEVHGYKIKIPKSPKDKKQRRSDGRPN